MCSALATVGPYVEVLVMHGAVLARFDGLGAALVNDPLALAEHAVVMRLGIVSVKSKFRPRHEAPLDGREIMKVSRLW